MTRRSVALGVCPAVIVALTVLWGCGTGGKAPAQGRAYPSALRQASVADIQAFRDGTDVRFTNTSPRTFGPSTLWANARFAHEIKGLAPGEAFEIDLRRLRDQYGEKYRGGGFFASEPPQPLVLLQIETDGTEGREMVGLVVVKGE